MGELIVFQSLSRRPVKIFKHLLLLNHRANQAQISYGDSLGHGSVVRLLDFHNRSSKIIVQQFSIDDRL